MSIDTIGDFLTIIRNGLMSSKLFVIAPYSQMKNEIASILKDEGFIKDFVIADEEGKQNIKIVLKYVEGESVIHELKRISRPGRRDYKGANSIKPVIGGLGLSILTTSKGIMSHKKARDLGIGGEVLLTVW